MIIIFCAHEPLFDKNGSQTREHWITIEKEKKQFTFYLGDERGIIQFKVGNLEDLLNIAIAEIGYYDMNIETDLTNSFLEEKEKVEFT